MNIYAVISAYTGGVRAMTNRKFKDYHKNVIVHKCVEESGRNLARILLALNKVYPKVFYAKTIQEWMELYPDTCRKMDMLDAADAFDYKIERLCEEYGIDGKWCMEFVRRNSDVTNADNIKVLANNIKVALVHTCSQYGIGRKRLAEIQAELDKEQLREPEKELKKFGINMESQSVGEMDYRKLVPKKQKEASYEDIKRGYQGLAALKAYQDEVNKA